MSGGIPLLLLLLLRDARRQVVALSLHGLALAVSAFLVVMLATIVGFLAREDAPGAPCSADVRRLELRDRSGALQVAPAVLAAALDAGSSLRTHVIGSQRLRDPDAAGGHLAFARAPDAFLRAVCLERAAGLLSPDAVPGPRGFGGRGLARAPGVEHWVEVPEFRGIAGVGGGATWVRERDVAWLRLDPDGWDDVVLVERGPGRSWASVEREVQAFVLARPALFTPGTQPRWILASGLDSDALRRGLRGLVLLGLVAAGILALVVANLSVYFVGRHPRFAMTATVLSVLGLPRARLGLIAAFEPGLLALLALPVGVWAATRYLAAQPGFDNAVIDAWPIATTAALLGAGVALVAWRRVAATRASLRPGVAGFRRLSGRLASLLVLVQVAAAVPLVALSLQAGVGWRQSVSAQPPLAPGDLWMAQWQRQSSLPPSEAIESLAAVERADPGIALAANLLPLPGGAAVAGEVQLVIQGRRVAVAHNQAGPRFLELSLGLPRARAEAWLGVDSAGPPPVVVSRSLATHLSPLPRLLTLAAGPASQAGPEVVHQVAGTVPDLANLWTGQARHPGLVLTGWNHSAPPASGVMLARADAVPMERFQRAARRLGSDLGEVTRVDAAVDRAVQGDQQMAKAFTLMAIVGIACMLVGLVSVLRGVEVARALEFSVLFALGAKPARVARVHLQRLAMPAAVGAGLGGVAALAATWVIAGRRPLLEPLAVPASVAALLAVAALATVCALASASRVSRRDPMPALRSE